MCGLRGRAVGCSLAERVDARVRVTRVEVVHEVHDKRKDEDDDATPENDIRQAHSRERTGERYEQGRRRRRRVKQPERGTPFGLLLYSSPNLNAG